MEFFTIYQMASDITLWFTLNTAEDIAFFTGNWDYMVGVALFGLQ